MGKDKWADKPNGDPNWADVGSLGGLIVTSHDPPPFDTISVYGLNPYSGSTRLVGGGGDAGLWIDGIQGSAEDVTWNWDAQGTVRYDIIRSARIPYLIKADKVTNRKKEYLDHILVGYTDVTNIDVGTTYGWTNRQDKLGGVKGNIRELGTFLVEDLWPGTTQARAVRNWWIRNTSGNMPPQDFGHLNRGYNVANGIAWPFRETSPKVYEMLRICLADEAFKLRYLIVGYEGGGGW